MCANLGLMISSKLNIRVFFFICLLLSGKGNSQTILDEFSIDVTQGQVLLAWTIKSGSLCNGIQIYRSIDSLNFSEIKNNNLIVLNGINNISLALKNSLKDFMNSGGIVLMIPGSKGDVLSYNQLISTQTKHSLKPLKLQEKSITGIEFNHTVLKDVFKTKVSNFQYPSVKSYYPVTASSNKILTFEDQQAFLSQFNSLFVFTASLDAVNSNCPAPLLLFPVLSEPPAFSVVPIISLLESVIFLSLALCPLTL